MGKFQNRTHVFGNFLKQDKNKNIKFLEWAFSFSECFQIKSGHLRKTHPPGNFPLFLKFSKMLVRLFNVCEVKINWIL